VPKNQPARPSRPWIFAPVSPGKKQPKSALENIRAVGSDDDGSVFYAGGCGFNSDMSGTASWTVYGQSPPGSPLFSPLPTWHGQELVPSQGIRAKAHD